jgi:hypothetical protein
MIKPIRLARAMTFERAGAVSINKASKPLALAGWK